jgi:hypothetical protein
MRHRQSSISSTILMGLFLCDVLASAGGRNLQGGNGSDSNSEIIAKLASAKKPAVGQPLVINGETVCGAKGNTGNKKMQELNNNKNRTDEPGPDEYVPIDWDVMANLSADAVNEIQGAPVTVVGYLSNKVNVESRSPGESTNCNLLDPDEVDWHMYLTDKPKQQIKFSIIVETTPRVRPHHKWTTDMLTPYVNHSKQVRISGWLLYDFQHLNVVGKERGTVWEVHPITRIEVQNAQGEWANIEQ